MHTEQNSTNANVGGPLESNYALDKSDMKIVQDYLSNVSIIDKNLNQLVSLRNNCDFEDLNAQNEIRLLEVCKLVVEIDTDLFVCCFVFLEPTCQVI